MNAPLMDPRQRRLRQLRLRDLGLLDAIDAHGTLQGAARALFVTQPAVSQALRSLEDAVGVPLAVRSRRGVALTDAGRALRVHLQAAHASLAAGLEHLDAAPPRPVLRLGTIPYGLIDVIPRALARLGDAPFTLRIVSGAVDGLMRALADGEIDAALLRPVAPRAATADVPRLHATPVGSIRNAIACGRDHPLARRRPGLAELARAGWVLPPEASVVRTALGDLFARAGHAPPQPRVVSGNFVDNLRIAAAARLLTVAPVDVVEAARPAMTVLLAPPGWEGALRLVCPAHLGDWPPLAALRAALASAAQPARARPSGSRRPPGRASAAATGRARLDLL